MTTKVTKESLAENIGRLESYGDLSINEEYQFDTGCEKHVIFNGRLMTHQKTSLVLYTRRGVTKTERANGYEKI